MKNKKITKVIKEEQVTIEYLYEYGFTEKKDLLNEIRPHLIFNKLLFKFSEEEFYLCVEIFKEDMNRMGLNLDAKSLSGCIRGIYSVIKTFKNKSEFENILQTIYQVAEENNKILIKETRERRICENCIYWQRNYHIPGDCTDDTTLGRCLYGSQPIKRQGNDKACSKYELTEK